MNYSIKGHSMSEQKDENKYSKFVWQTGDITSFTEEEFEKLVKEGKFHLYEFQKSYPCCDKAFCCNCDKEDIEFANEISFIIFQFIKREYFQAVFKNEPIKPLITKVFKSLISLCKKIINNRYVLTKQIYCAVYMSLLDHLARDKDLELTQEDLEALIELKQV